MQQFGLPKFSMQHGAHALTVVVVACSVLFQLIGTTLQALLIFIPTEVVYHLHIWRIFTSLPIARSPLEVIFSGVIIYSLGSTLEYSLGKKRFFKLVVGLPLLGNVLTLIPALLFPTAFYFPFFGAGAIVTTLWIVYGLRAERTGQQLNFWGIPMPGRTFAYIGLGFVVLQGIFSPTRSFPLLAVVPDLIAALCAFLIMQGRLRANFLESIQSAYYSWKLKRLKSKRGIHVVVNENPSKKDDYTVH